MSPLERANTAEQSTMQAMEIRADLEDVLELNAACFQRPWTREILVKELARPEVAYIFTVRSSQQRVVEYCATWIILDELHINSVAVRSDWRCAALMNRRGLCINDLVSSCREFDLTTIRILVKTPSYCSVRRLSPSLKRQCACDTVPLSNDVRDIPPKQRRFEISQH
jgi:hypothetical protein